MTKTHIAYFDTLKGIAILLMLIGHCLAWNYQDYVTIIVDGRRSDMFWWHLIYSFHMPLFFWISGYFLPRDSCDLNDIKGVLWRRTYTLLIPFVCSGTLMSLLLGNWGGYINLWFLRALYEISVLALLYEFVRYRFCLSLKSDIIFYVVLYVAIKEIINTPLDKVLHIESITGGNYIGFVFGVFCKRYNKLIKILDTNLAYTICLILFTILSCAYFQYLSDNCKFWSLISRFRLTPISAIVCILYLTKYKINQETRVAHLLNYLGKYSLEIYIIHFLFNFRVFMITDYAIELIHSDNCNDFLWGHTFMLITSVLISVVMIILCLLVIHVIRTSNILSVFLLGRKNVQIV